MIGEIVIGLMGIIFLAGAIMQFQCKGPVWSVEYVAASHKGKKKLRVRQEYFWNGMICLWIGLLFILIMIYTLSQIMAFLYLLFILAGILFIQIILGGIRAARNSTKRDTEIRKRKQ